MKKSLWNIKNKKLFLQTIEFLNSTHNLELNKVLQWKQVHLLSLKSSDLDEYLLAPVVWNFIMNTDIFIWHYWSIYKSNVSIGLKSCFTANQLLELTSEALALEILNWITKKYGNFGSIFLNNIYKTQLSLPKIKFITGFINLKADFQLAFWFNSVDPLHNFLLILQ